MVMRPKPALFSDTKLVRNATIREMVGTTPILHHIEQQRVKWFGHLTRMPISHPAHRAYNMKMTGYKARGRPRKTWISGVKETLTSHGITPRQAFQLAADRRLFLPATPPDGTSGQIKQSIIM